MYARWTSACAHCPPVGPAARLAAFQSEGKLYMVLNYLPGGELFYRLKREGRFSPERVKLYTAEIALGLGAPTCARLLMARADGARRWRMLMAPAQFAPIARRGGRACVAIPPPSSLLCGMAPPRAHGVPACRALAFARHHLSRPQAREHLAG